MNTTKKGDILEEKALGIVQKFIDDGLLGMPKEYARVFTKKKYPSNVRESGLIEFDLTVEIWPPNADRFFMIYFIECKNYKNRVPIEKIKKFYADILEASGVNAKGIVISNAPFQKGAYDYAMAKRMMVIEGESKDNFKITLYKRNYPIDNHIPIIKETHDKSYLNQGVTSLEKIIDKQILSSLIKSQSSVTYGIDLLSKSNIQEIAERELINYDNSHLANAYGLDFNSIVKYLLNEHCLMVEFSNPSDKNYLGTCNIEKKTIGISKSIVNTPRVLFVLCHEFGHFILHQKLSINQQLLDSFSDSKRNLATGKNSLENPRHWIEWQANYFSISFLLPRTSLMAMLWKSQLRRNIPKGKLYFDDQYRNQKSFQDILSSLSNHFSVSKTSIIFRLKEFELINDNSRTKSIKQIIDEYGLEYFV